MATFSLTDKQRKMLLKLPVAKLLSSESTLAGRHENLQLGDEADFSELKPYELGDEVRRVDWKTYLRTERLYIKRFSNENAKQVYFFIDTSASMKSPETSSALQFLPLFCNYLEMHAEAYGAVFFKETTFLFQAAKRGAAHLRKMEQLLEEQVYVGKSDFERLLPLALRRIPPRTDLVFFSDFHFDLSLLSGMKKIGIEKQLSFFLIALVSKALYQIQFSQRRGISHYLKDREDGTSVFFSRALLAQYQQLVAQHYLSLERLCRRHSLRYLRLAAEAEPFLSFLRCFAA